MELYYIIAITDHDRGEAMGSLYHAAGLHLILSMPARGTATSEHLAIYGLDATEKCVIAAVGSAQEADSLIRSAKRKLFIDIPGNGVMLTVPLKSVAGGKTLSYLTDDLKAGGAPNMNFEHELITVILNEGYSDFVMDAARAAGAGGGDALGLAGADVFPFALGHEGENLQDEIGDEGPHEVLAVAGVQEGHVQDADVHADVLGEQPPLVLDVLVVAAQAVDAGHAEQVPGPQALHQALVLGALEILAGLAV